jgi:hypothetical protein
MTIIYCLRISYFDSEIIRFSTDSRIPIGTNCAPLLADLFLYSYEADFIRGLLEKNEKKLALFFISRSAI